MISDTTEAMMTLDSASSKGQPKGTMAQLAYGGVSNPSSWATYRVERGFPFKRAGKNVAAIPQFKTATVYSHTSDNAPAPFQQTSDNVSVKWPALE